MFITGIGDFTDVAEKKTFDLRSRISASSGRNPDIELVVIGEDDLAEIGPFPWPRVWAIDTKEQRSWPNISERC